MSTPADIVDAARMYLRVPVRHQGRKDALDCVGLVLAVAEDLALVDVAGEPILRAQYRNYPAQPVNAFVQEECKRRLKVRMIPTMGDSLAKVRRELEPGDVITMKLPSVPCHAGIVSDLRRERGIVHAYSPVGKVVEHRLDDPWIHRIAGVFYFPGVT